MHMKHTILLVALLGLTMSADAALADSTSTAVSSLNQVSLSYDDVTSGGSASDFTGATAQVSYLNSLFGVNAVYLEADASEASTNVAQTFAVNDYNYNLKAGKAFAYGSAVFVPYAHIGHEVINVAFDAAAADTFGVGAKALYSPMARLTLSADLSADHATGDVSGALATPNGLVTQEAVGVDYAITQRVHLSAGYGHRAFDVGGMSASDKVATLGIGLGY